MKEPSTETLASWLAEELDSSSWTRIANALTDLLRKRLIGYSPADCQALAEERELYVAEQVRNNAATAKHDGQVYPIDVDQQDPYVRSLSDRITAELDTLRGMDPYDFEVHCREILSALGGQAHVTPKTNDGGIDFYATNIKLVPSEIPFPIYASITVVGQAKRYKEGVLVTLNDVRQFVGSTVRFVADLRSRRQIPDAGPVLMAFWTTSYFHSSAMEYSRNIGLWTVDGRAIVNLTRHCKVPIEK